MQFIAKYIFLLIVSVCVKDIQCDLNRQQIWQILQNMYGLSNEQRAVTRRNIDLTLPGSGVFQEPSSRDLSVGFAVGVKDDGNDSDILKTAFSPTPSIKPPSSDVYVTNEPSSYAKELNIGVYVDPKNGVSYYTPAYAPVTTYPKVLPTQQYTYFNPYQQPFPINPYPLTTQTPSYLQNIPNRVNWNEPTLPYRINNQQAYPYSRTQFPIYSENILNTDSNLQQPYPYMGVYKQPIDFIPSPGGYPYSSKYLPIAANQFSEPSYAKQNAFNVFDTTPFSDNYSPFGKEERYPRSHGRTRHRGSNTNYILPMRNLQNAFQIEEHVPKGYYNQFYQPLVTREEPQEQEIILDDQGNPMMSVQPVGDRQVGTFKLKNDHGYQVTMNVPPVPAEGPKDGILVMEMKASLYRPLI